MSTETLKVLLLEDNPGDADLLQEILYEANGVVPDITHVELLSHAIAQIQQHSFSVVLSDLSLPDAQGLDTVIQIHALAPNLPIVVLTGLSDEDTGLEALRQGAQDYLVKGQISQELLMRTIRYAIERSQTQRVMWRQTAAMAASMEGIAILNANRELIYVNRAFAKLYGYADPDQLIGTTWEILHAGAASNSLDQQVRSAIQQHGYWHGESIASRHNGETFDQELSITPLGDGGFVCNVRDVTQRKQAETEILRALERERELNELKSHFVAVISHEFRTPLTSILAATELLQRYSYQGSDEKTQVRFKRIINGVHRMTRILDDVLISNKAEMGKLPFNLTLLDVEKFCSELVEEMQSQISTNQKIYIVCRSSDNNCYLDEHLLHHILGNLISNAIKYSLQGGDVEVEFWCEPQQVTFRVKDYGIGISAEDQEQLFTIFQRGSNVGTIPGTGLGLAIVKHCVDLHGGKITVVSEEGEGTEFTVTLPTRLAVEL